MGFASVGSLVAALTAAGSAASAGLSIANAVKGSPKAPSPLQPTREPDVDAFRRQNAGSSLLPGAAAVAAGGTAGNGGNVGTSTLLGQ